MKRFLLQLLAFLLSPIAEKQPHKILAQLAPVVLSARRISLVVTTWYVAQAIKPNMGWPAALVAVVSVLAWSLHDALAAKPEASIELTRELIRRHGIGDAGTYVPHQWANGDPDAGLI